MKKIIALTLAAIACVCFTGCNKTAEPDNSALEAARKDAAAVSNQLTEVSMKLNHFEQMVKVLELEVTNLTQTVHQYSNRVVELRAHLADQQKQLIAAQTEVPKRDLRIAELENKLQEQALQMSRLTAQLGEGNSRVPALEKQLAALEEQKSHWQADMARLKYERDELLRLWDDAKALEARLNVVDPQRLKKTLPKVDKNTRLTLSPQGGVKVSPASALPPAKSKDKKPAAKTTGQNS
jgi:chromosome segregation ATPase